MTTFKILAAGASALAIMTGAGLAQSTENFRASEVAIADFIGTVKIGTGGRDVAVKWSRGDDASYPVRFDREGDRLVIHSDENPDKTKWRRDVNWRGDSDKAFAEFLKDYPTLEITVPSGTDIEFKSAVVSLGAGDTNGDFTVNGGHVDGRIGDVASADVGIHGSNDLTVGDVKGALMIAIHGSGDFKAGTAESLAARIHGSGDIETGAIKDDASASIHGSGDITVASAGGDLDAEIHGSGDISFGDVGGGVRSDSFGSGDVFLASMSGPASFRMHGSGDTEIRGGRAENLKLQIMGSGDFSLNGVATNPDINAMSSGSVTIARHEGSIRTSGHGSIRISNRRYGDDD